jgi:ABC-type transport system involved in cytochrome bd biosynthesis fused ATPase/permease subunit
MDFSPKANFYIRQIKSNLKFILVGVVIVALLAFGFVVAMTLLVVLIIAIPILRLWVAYKLKNKPKQTQKKETVDFIDVEYEIIERKKDRKE